jgi:redox-sensitive bicupin YhaK (pirin superfamily)
VLYVVAGDEGAHFVLCAGQPQGDRIVSYGPFVGDAKQDIVRLFTEYRAGQFVRMTELAREDG